MRQITGAGAGNYWDGIGWFERFITTLALFFSTGAILTFIYSFGKDADQIAATTDPVQQFVWATIYAVVVVFIARRFMPVARIVRSNMLILALMAWSVASVLWSIEPMYSLNRIVALVGTTAFGLYLGTRYDRHQLLHLLTVALFWMGVCSVTAVVMFPSDAIHHGLHEGAWRGVLSHKNHLGRLGALGAIVAFVCVRDSGSLPARRGFYKATFALMVLCAVMSMSKTALLLLVLNFALFFVLQLFALRRLALTVLLSWICIIGAFLAYQVASYVIENALGAMGRDMTMTGRTYIWETLFIALQDHWLLGFGPGAFWVSGQGALGMNWLTTGGWVPPHAHNGVLEVLVSYGLVGLALLAAVYIKSLRAAGAALDKDHAVDVFPLLYFIMMLVADMTEISIMRHNNVYWILFIALAVRLIAQHPRSRWSRTTELALTIRENVARTRSRGGAM